MSDAARFGSLGRLVVGWMRLDPVMTSRPYERQHAPANVAIACMRCNHDRADREAPPSTAMPLDLVSAARR